MLGGVSDVNTCSVLLSMVVVLIQCLLALPIIKSVVLLVSCELLALIIGYHIDTVDVNLSTYENS